jgi:hypothetical protein
VQNIARLEGIIEQDRVELKEESVEKLCSDFGAGRSAIAFYAAASFVVSSFEPKQGLRGGALSNGRPYRERRDFITRLGGAAAVVCSRTALVPCRPTDMQCARAPGNRATL